MLICYNTYCNCKLVCILCSTVNTFCYSDIASMRRDGVATLYGSVQFQLKSVPALNYHAKDPTYPK